MKKVEFPVGHNYTQRTFPRTLSEAFPLDYCYGIYAPVHVPFYKRIWSVFWRWFYD